MATTTKKASTPDSPAKTKTPAGVKNKPAVKNPSVNTIKARPDKAVAPAKTRSVLTKESYRMLENNWSE